MSGDKTDFLRRWSRLKREAAQAPVPAAAPTAEPAAAEAPPLPPLDSLTFESDFKAFMGAKVEESVKRAALKKLFSDPRFNVMDGLDTYIDDYSIENPIPESMLAKLEHARTTLFGPQPEKPEEPPAPDEAAPAQASEKKDGDPGQDPQAV